MRFTKNKSLCNFQMKNLLPQNNFFPKNSFTLLLKYMVLTILLLASNAATHSIIFARKMEQICGLDTAAFLKRKNQRKKYVAILKSFFVRIYDDDCCCFVSKQFAIIIDLNTNIQAKICMQQFSLKINSKQMWENVTQKLFQSI